MDLVYTAYLTTIAEKHGVSLHAFADDIQLYLHCRRGDTASAATQLERCIADVGRWMSGNRLKLDTDKPSCGLDRDIVFTSTTFVCQNYMLVMTQS